MEFLKLFELFFQNLPKMTEKVKPFAKNVNISVEEALLLLAYYYSENFEISVSAEIKQMLIEKKLLEYNDKKLKFSSKGDIIVKSIVNGLKR